MKTILSNRILITLLLISLIISSGFGQSLKSLEQILPMEDIDQSTGKISKQSMGIGSSVTVNIIADLKDANACQKVSVTDKGLELNFTWYNKDDETGQAMLEMISMLNAIPQQMESFKNESGFDANEAKEEVIPGGKLWIITNHKECINSISGPTGVTVYSTQLRAFVFNGTTIMKINIRSLSKPERIKEMALKIIEKANAFDFSPLKDVVGYE